jgi:prepilin signal peptidase PulO-like enzyme (type II secretory pathway)
MLPYYGFVGALSFLLGAIFGSFLNVVIYRTGSGVGYSGRSRCLSCGKDLTAMMLIPLFSFLFQGGRCAYCKAKLSWQYPLVEAASGALFVMVWWVTKFDPLASSFEETILFGLELLIWLTLLLIVAYDVKHKIIPDRFSLTFALLAGALALLRWHWGFVVPQFLPLFGVYTPVWLDLLAGPLLALPFALLWLFSGGRAMGLGDAKLVWGLGWLLGFAGGISAVILAFWTAFFPSIILLFLPRKHFTMKSEIPFAPFLILGALLVFVCGIDILQWSF